VALILIVIPFAGTVPAVFAVKAVVFPVIEKDLKYLLAVGVIPSMADTDPEAK